MSKRKTRPQDVGTGKVANDRNRVGDRGATQTNQGERSPLGRHDRDDHLGASNQPQSRKGRAGGGQR